jgi:hypothetical protein
MTPRRFEFMRDCGKMRRIVRDQIRFEKGQYCPTERGMRRVLVALVWMFVLLVPLSAVADDVFEYDRGTVTDEQSEEEQTKKAVSNLPLNFYGRGGLLLTSSTRSLDLLDVEPGLAYIYEDSTDPEFTRQTMAFNVAFGIGGNVMLYAHIPYVMTDLHYGEGFNALGLKERQFSTEEQSGIGSVEAGVQWAFFMQDRFLPGMAIGATYIAPTGDYTQHLGQVKSYGFKANLAMSLEVIDLFFTEYAFAIFADASAVFRDLGLEVDGEKYEEKHGLIHTGLLFPLHPRNFVHFMLEYEGLMLNGRDNTDDENGALAGLRFTTDRIGVTAGAMYVFREAEDMDDSLRYMGTGSFRFW